MDVKPDTPQRRKAHLDLLQTLPELLTQHIPERAGLEAFREYSNREKRWVSVTYGELNDRVQQWREAFASLGLQRGDRCAMLLPNCIDAVCFDQAVLSDAFVPVPLHAIDTPGSSAYIMQDSNARVLVTNKYLKWKGIRDTQAKLPDLMLVVITDDEVPQDPMNTLPVLSLKEFLEKGRGTALPPPPKGTDLAALVYTSGTTGKPKGVMLTHQNILCNMRAVMRDYMPDVTDKWFSFLPLSHTFERTTTYYIGLGMANTVIFFRSFATFAEDLKYASPSLMMAVPRVYETIHAKILREISRKPPLVQKIFNYAVDVGWRQFCRKNHMPFKPSPIDFLDPFVAGFLDRKVGASVRSAFGTNNKIHLFVSGGAALNPEVARCLISLGIPIVQGYGMTECSPIISLHRPNAINPRTVGAPLPNVEMRLGDGNEVLVRGTSVMQGYWKLPEATAKVLDPDGWLHTGDVGEITADGDLILRGRIKEIIVTSTGEKVPPGDLEHAIEVDPLVSQVMVCGDNRPFITAIIVVDPEGWRQLCAELKIDPEDPESLRSRAARQAVLRRVKSATRDFPNYGVPRDVLLTREPWTIENGLLTPTLKLKRGPIHDRLSDALDLLYKEHK